MLGGYVVRMGGAGSGMRRSRPASIRERLFTRRCDVGAAAKLVNQQLTAANALAATEGLALARGIGMDEGELRQLLQLLDRSWGSSPRHLLDTS